MIKAKYHFVQIVCLIFCIHISISQSQKQNVSLTKDQKEFVLNASVKQIEDSLLQCYNLGKYDLLFRYSHYLESEVYQENDSIKYFANYYLTDHYYYNQPSDYKTALVYSHKSVEASKSLEAYKRVRAFNFRGHILYELGKYQEALESYLIGLKTAKRDELLISEVLSQMYIANVKIRIKDFEEGKHIYNEVLNLLAQKKYIKKYEESPNGYKEYNETYVNALNGLGICLRDTKENKLAIENFDTALSYLEIHDINNDKEILKATIQTNLGKAYSNIEDNGNASTSFDVSKEIFLANENLSNAYFQNVLFRAEFYKKNENVEKALKILDEGFERRPKDQYPPELLEMYDLAILLSQQQGNIQKENSYSSLRREMTDAIHENDVATRTLENKELSIENSELSQKNEIISNNLNSTLKIVGILIVSILLLGGFYYRNALRNKKKFKSLMQELNTLSTTVTSKKEVQTSFTITDDKAKTILRKLEKLEVSLFFIHNNCTLHNTAKKLKTNTTYLSKIINTYKEQSFNEYVNKLRINYVLQQIKENTQFRRYTISAIARELGYKSANTFTNAFKRETGINPSYYIKQIEKSIPVKKE